MIIALIGIVVGIIIGLYMDVTFSLSYSPYMSVAILASMDSVFGGIRATLEDKFNAGIFISGFFGNAILAALLAYIGDKLGVPLYYAAIFAFGIRLFNNFAIIRRFLFNKNHIND